MADDTVGKHGHLIRTAARRAEHGKFIAADAGNEVAIADISLKFPLKVRVN
jgi:hypothetical protein